MFFKKFEFNNFNVFFSNSAIRGYNSYSALLVITSVLLINALVISTSGVFLRTCLFGLSFFFLAYWVISIFTYLFKKAQFGTYTRMIQRFWKRSLYLFWLLEIGLFSIYLFLAIISPQEVAYMLDNTQLVITYGTNLLPFFQTTLRPVLVILLCNIYLLSHKYNTYRTPIVAVLTIFLVYGLFEDFLQFYAINQQYSNIMWSHVSVESTRDVTINANYVGVWELELGELKLRTFVHYLYLLIFLKLWHTLFIVYFFIFFENIRLITGQSSFNAISANLQNLYFLMFFNYILKISLIKYYLNYLGTFVYYWFYTSTNAYDLGYLYMLLSKKYFFFLISDLICAI